MNASINPKSAATFTAKGSQNSVPLGVWCAIMFAVLVFGNLHAVAFAQSSSYPGIYVKVLNIKTGVGTLACALFDSPVDDPIEVLCYATHIMVIEIQDVQTRNDLSDIPPETYELAVIHDENMDGKLDTNRLGIPTEGYGFSSDVNTLLGAPLFSAARFPYDGQDQELTISLHY